MVICEPKLYVQIINSPNSKSRVQPYAVKHKLSSVNFCKEQQFTKQTQDWRMTYRLTGTFLPSEMPVENGRTPLQHTEKLVSPSHVKSAASALYRSHTKSIISFENWTCKRHVRTDIRSDSERDFSPF